MIGGKVEMMSSLLVICSECTNHHAFQQCHCVLTWAPVAHWAGHCSSLEPAFTQNAGGFLASGCDCGPSQFNFHQLSNMKELDVTRACSVHQIGGPQP